MKNKKSSVKLSPRTTRVRPSRRQPARPAVHRRVLKHPATLFGLLVVGVLLGLTTFRVHADDYTVQASVAGTPPTSPAVISQPTDDSHVTTAQQDVSGTCPTGSYVKLYINHLFAGVVTCSSSGDFTITAYLLSGANTLTARVFSSTDDEGPTSPDVTVYYDAPANDGTPSSPSPSPAPTSSPQSDTPADDSSDLTTVPTDSATDTSPFWLLSDYHYGATPDGEPVSIDLAVQGGRAPFALAIDWGDGEVQPWLMQDGNKINLSHHYIRKDDRTTYMITVTATDARQIMAHLQLMAVVNGRDTVAAAGAAKSGDTTGPASPASSLPQRIAATTKQWLWVAWPTYGTVSLMATSYWLGEHEGIRQLLQLRLRHWR